VKKIFFVFFCFSSLFSNPYDGRTIVVLDPAGHAGDLGRWLVAGYERAQTLKFAEAVRAGLLSKANLYTVISRKAGEKVLPLQIPSFSNRLGADIFLRIHMYREESEKPQLHLYHLQFDPFIDLAPRSFDTLSLTPIYQAHFENIHKTRFYGNKMCEHLSQDSFSRYFNCHDLIGLPLKNLVGVKAKVSILLEVGICREDKWKSLVKPIVDSLLLVINGERSHNV